MKAVCNKPRRDKYCCEKVKQIPYPKFRDRESVKAFHNHVDRLVYLPVCSLRLSHTVMKVYDKPQTISQRSALRVSKNRFQVSRKLVFSLKFLFFSLSNNLFTFVL